MAKFLNTDLLNEWILRLIEETERELVIIVPYIKTSGRVYKQLFEANQRGVETTIVYRENKLSPEEKKKFESLDNLNLMYHPNVHAKCYYNEKYMIIGSMNLYEYSEKNNREMGVLLNKEAISEADTLIHQDDKQLFEDAVNEINTIIKSSEIEKKSRETQVEGFEINILKNRQELAEESCKQLNKIFLHKKFKPGEWNGEWKCVCENYFDHINVILERRACLFFNYPEERVEQIFKKVVPHYHEYRFDGYKFYWNHYKSPIFLYPNSRHQMWSETHEAEDIDLMKNGIDQVISFLRPFI